jgi:formylglycine-generating enzyme required for sulfatase activity
MGEIMGIFDTRLGQHATGTVIRDWLARVLGDVRIVSLIGLSLTGAFLLAQSSNPAKNAIAIQFVKIQPGDFVMGCSTGDDKCNADEKPAHHVQITKAFEIGKYEVTQAQWTAVMGSNPSTIKGDDRPVETVSKNEAHEFIARLNARNDGYKYRLPTEAEWEYAARAGSAVPQGASLSEFAWFADNSEDETHPVGQKKPNAWGLYDMLGNVREWVEDQYARDFYSSSPAADPTGPQGAQGRGRGNFGRRGGRGPVDQQPAPQRRGNFGRGGPGRQLPVVRGGAWDNPADFVRVSARYHYYGPTLRVSDIGFRVVREPAAAGGDLI